MVICNNNTAALTADFSNNLFQPITTKENGNENIITDPNLFSVIFFPRKSIDTFPAVTEIEK